MSKHIERILIVNRGEIARRIIRTAHNMGIGTVAIYADGDVGEPFVAEADQAVALGGTSSLETYLDQDKVLAAAKRTGADAIHPGYGFLSENTTFAAAVKDAGMIWIGPNSDAISQMGDKLSSKKLMTEAGVPTLPSAEVETGADVQMLASDIGYPLLVKASAGGGGKGMRVVESEAELEAAVEGARREAGAAFGDDTIFLERWLSSSRHVEIQVLGDEQGNAVHCFERECSIQRRHQKIIEEAPSSAVTPELREKMGAAAVAAANSIGYTSAGTVEFLLDGDDFWFLEMNTRLQVEHPVTEEITGLDLVREQILVAQGESLSFAQEDLSINGHAIEARIYGEDPAKDFLPTAGPVLLFERSKVADARFDSGIETGSVVGIEFDPMLAKVIVHAPTRAEAALRLARVLETTRIQGLTTNRDFLVAVLRTQAFLDGDTTTDFIERINPPRGKTPDRGELIEGAIAAAMVAQGDRRAESKTWHRIPSGWRNSVMPPELVEFTIDDEEITLEYQSRRNGSFVAMVDDLELVVFIKSRQGQQISLEIDGRLLAFTVTADGDRWLTHGPGGQVELIELPRFPDLDRAGLAGSLTAPMPGNVVETYVSEGDEVEEGQLLLILEGMKMEHRITAPHAGSVREIRVAKGDQVTNGEVLVVLAEDEEE
ncbi:MAG: biotin carboxylase N-terminal domain-containing protein [bacterium]|nr:biotin/lipoyl-binding protein [Gammaproteobacteria bacterium]HIL97123.1 biotin/lipoyl-binding protein [Pseudomonadales bacterium]